MNQDNSTENKFKKNYKTQFLNNLIFKDENKKQNLNKKEDWVIGGRYWKKYSIKKGTKKINRINLGQHVKLVTRFLSLR